MSLLTGKTSDFLKIGVAAAGRGDLETVRTVLVGAARLVVARWVARADDALGSGVPGAVGDGRMVA